MIRFFRSSFFVQYFIICITGLILWGRAFFDPPVMPAPEGYVPFYSFICELISPFPIIQVIVGFLMVSASAIFLNLLLYNHNIVHKNSSLAGFIYVILMSYYPDFLTLQPVNISVVFLLIILDQLLQSYNKAEPLDHVYAAGFFTAIGSYFYFPFLFFYLFVVVSLFILRIVRWRELVSSLFGLLTPFLFLGTWYFWFEYFLEKANEYTGLFTVSIDLTLLKQTGYLILTAVIVLISVYSAIYGIMARPEKTIEKKRKNLVVNWIIIFVLVSVPFSSLLSGYHIQLSFIPFSGLIAFYLLQIRKTQWQEVILLIFVLVILVNNLIFQWP